MNPLSVGDPVRLGPYRLLGVLGAGGMGKVYAGQDDSGTIAAVKVLHPELAHEQNLAKRFVREAHAAQAVTSTGVARVLGAQTEGGRPWIATEFLAGPTLAQAVEAHGPFGDAAVRSMAASIAATLVDVHAAGLIHRDLKPQNIVLTSGGPRVIDFGIARPEHGLTLTTTGQIPVTPGYGAPEQVLGRRVSSAADVFSLGAVLAYAASGNRAFDGANVAVLQYEVVHGEPRLDGVPEPLQVLVRSCLAKDPAERPTPEKIVSDSAPPRGAERVWRRGGLAADIKAREHDVKGMSTSAPSPAGPRHPVGRRQLILGGVTAGVVAVAGGGATTAWWLVEKRAEDNLFSVPDAADTPEADRLSEGDGYVPGRPPKALWTLAGALHPESPKVLPVRDVVVFGHAKGGLAAHDVVDGKQRWNTREVRGTARCLSLSDSLIAAVDDRGTLRTYVASTGDPKWTADAEADVLLAADEAKVYLVTKSGELRSVRRRDAKTEWTVDLPRPFRGKTLKPATAAAGRGRLVVATGSGDVLALDTDDGGKAWAIPELFNGQLHPARWGDTVYVGGDSLTAYALSDGEERWKRTERSPGSRHQPWGPPVAGPNALYATHGLTPGRLNPSDGRRLWDSREESAFRSELALQGRTLWSVDDKRSSRLNAVGTDDGRTVWNYPLPEARLRRKLAADGNRVFVMNDHALYALPVL